ncbi:hypothetical protein GCM10022251_74940 [Phytohabitans flavus]|uniref:Uncharacterized protein n=1 Tax=Phytohabitans flavus TaxID=1076124 RepID=A0A6F8XLG1_9ACTN|nr:hypothetical protein [Phytohabitans flavus]BCB74647.1 hypothetical protein Pflav_010570 [Phytohabitans flavus]
MNVVTASGHPRTHLAPAHRRPARRGMHVLLSAQSVIIILVSVNRLSDATTGFVASNEFLRWVDLNNLILGGASLLVLYLLMRQLEYDSPRRDGTGHRWLGFVFQLGAYLYSASYGLHEVTNYLNNRFCAAGDTGRQCEIIAFNDDEFSHYLFFVGFMVINVVVILTQIVFLDDRRPSGVDNALLVLNALFIAAGIVANLGFEKIGLDLWVVAAVAAFTVVLLVRRPSQPILRYYGIAYVLGFVGALVAQLA